ncbi:uncharacterized protein LACBIDRAFT_311479 [Laccaria bicolor S238N-H82]|uniref:Predicted protein n=1 Tax=Laccaria bicolor (strain S238N-H82 / ATCC MYA-4686) TaxID=486041 RepID=B0CXH1_LACBS|nr:uncharacterized protein LACBIDRAFT_311479 [Laccaria bicolor S238N-H82]EDR12261.1 predicted protein [Laccaria bicolor S238N-H82]|eukprot:XP_001876525.1 predicted protein [Laccaria bicolor S238N-H82]
MNSATNESHCLFKTPLRPGSSRKRTHASVTNLHSHKRRRVSMASMDLSREFGIESSSGEPASTPAVDRFVPLRPKTFLPLNITPRTNRICKKLGLADDKIFNFRDDTEISSSSTSGDNAFGLLRRSVSSLFITPPAIRASSVVENLAKRRQCSMTLDSPGIPTDPSAYPISWSKRNLIAVACGKDVFYQNLDTKVVCHLFKCMLPPPADIYAIEWGEQMTENYLAAGNSMGWIQVWVAGVEGGSKNPVRLWGDPKEFIPIKSFGWNGNVLTVGKGDGTISLYDVRARDKVVKTSQHRKSVLGLRWSGDGTYLASGDAEGMVHVWDKRACKSLLDIGTASPKMRHKAGVKAIAWCPWKSDLFATGSYSPEGKIRFWSTSEIAHCPKPLDTLSLNTNVLSLQWSPHCKELLSTHGSSFTPPLSRRRSSLGIASREQARPTVVTPSVVVPSPLTNSIAVHEYPSGKRLLSLTHAHMSAVTHSCLSPDGESVFTACPKEETIKMWQVWSQSSTSSRKESAFDKFAIR